jgi:peptide-methionine (S)-S-oxide reductase
LTKATFGAGCFWGVEAMFARIDGVRATSVGYMGGSLAGPSYEDVCTGRTGHAEVVRIDFDPAAVTYEALLAAFWACHDPTQLNRQGPDIGTQYRSVIFTHDAAQDMAARAALAGEEAVGRHRRPIATIITPATDYWPAEDYHQQYLAKRGRRQ